MIFATNVDLPTWCRGGRKKDSVSALAKRDHNYVVNTHTGLAREENVFYATAVVRRHRTFLTIDLIR